MSSPTEAISVAEEFAFVEQETFDRFERVGYGPLVVQRSALLQKIINTADPMTSLHISGCKGAGKTTVLNLVGRHLSEQKENEIYFFPTASEFNREKVIEFVKALIKSKRPACLLVDETQANPTAALFVPLLKNTNKHNITIIGAGVPQFDSMSGEFVENITTDQLFLNSDAMLESENIVKFFSKGTTTQYQAHEVKLLLSRIRAYVGGHIYPFMWLSERLVPDILAGKSANDTFQSVFDSTFRESDDFKRMTSRILPRVSVDVFRTLFTLNPPTSAMKDLRRYGFCDQDNKVISQLLFDAYALSLRGTTPFQGRLEHGVVGVQQLLTFALPSINWEPYNAHGGPIEDAMTFELLLILSRVAHLGTRLFNPKLVNVAAGRKPDLYLNTSVDAYVEAVLTTSNCASERKKLDEHISRFYWEKYDDASKHAPPPYYEVAESDFAVLNYQSFGTMPLLPFDPYFQGDIFNRRVFTFLMTSKEVYLGSTRIGGP